MKLYGFNGDYVKTLAGQAFIDAVEKRFASYANFMETTETPKSLTPNEKNILQNNL